MRAQTTKGVDHAKWPSFLAVKTIIILGQQAQNNLIARACNCLGTYLFMKPKDCGRFDDVTRKLPAGKLSMPDRLNSVKRTGFQSRGEHETTRFRPPEAAGSMPTYSRFVMSWSLLTNTVVCCCCRWRHDDPHLLPGTRFPSPFPRSQGYSWLFKSRTDLRV